MRRYSFFIGAASAIVTFLALSAFTGARPWNRGSHWSDGWHRHGCDREDRFNRDGANDSSRGPDNRFRRATPIDSPMNEFSTADSARNR